MSPREPRYAWIAVGDLKAIAERAIAECVTEHGGKAVGEPTITVHRSGDGAVLTGLEASGTWWFDYMRVHGARWQGPLSEDKVKDVVDPRPPLGG